MAPQASKHAPGPANSRDANSPPRASRQDPFRRAAILSDHELQSLCEPGYHRVDSRLYMQVTRNRSGGCARSWIFRYYLAGKSHELGLGSYPLVSLSRALAVRDAMLLDLQAGQDPRVSRGERQTFNDCAQRLHAVLQHEWKDEEHATHWWESLQRFVLPAWGHRAVGDITAEDVLALLQPLWRDRRGIGYRMRGRIFRVLQWAEREGCRQLDPLLEYRVRQALSNTGAGTVAAAR